MERSILIKVLLSSAAYFAAAKFGLLLATINQSASPFWPAAGVGLAVVFVLGRFGLVAVWLGAFFANLGTPAPWSASLGIAIGNTLEAWAAVQLITWVAGRKTTFDPFTKPVGYLLAGLLAAVVGAGCGTTSLIATGTLTAAAALGNWTTWWVGDTLGMWVFGPALLILRPITREPKHSEPGILVIGEVMLLSLVAGAGTVLIFSFNGSSGLIFALFLCVLLSVSRLGSLASRPTVAVISICCVWLTVQQRGPFTSGTLNQNLIYLQLFLASIAISGLILESFRETGFLRVPSLILIPGWFLSALLYLSFETTDRNRDLRHFEELISVKTTEIARRLAYYEDELRTTAMFLKANPSVASSGWGSFVRGGRLLEKYPGIVAISRVEEVRDHDLPAFRSRFARRWPAGQKIRPPTGFDPGYSCPSHYVITLSEREGPGRSALGLDLCPEPVRRAALEKARSTGVLTIASLFETRPPSKEAGRLYLYYPLGPKNSTEGWIAAPLVPNDFLGSIAAGPNEELVSYMFDGASSSGGKPLYRSDGADLDAPLPKFEQTRALSFGQREFTLAWRRSSFFVSSHDTNAAWITTCSALLFILLASVIVALLSVTRRASIMAEERTRELAQSGRDLEERVAERTADLERMNRDLSDAKSALDQSFIFSMTDHRGVIVHINDMFCQISKYAREELIGKTHHRVNSGLHSKDFFRGLWQTISSGRIWRGEIQNRAKDGSLYWVDTVIVPFLGEDGRPHHYAAIRSDITEKKAHEQTAWRLLASEQAATQASALKTQFLANMSHEIRTPINGILGMASLLQDGALTSEQEDYARAICSSADSLLTVINDILDISKIEANRLEFEEVSFSLADEIHEAVRGVLILAQRKGLPLLLDLAPDLPAAVIGDPGRLRQVFNNLLGNAIKFTKVGRVILRASRLGETPEGVRLRFEIQDNGVGIPEAVQARMFEAFSQADASTTRRFGGTGLGLSISKHLVERMGGRIGLVSKANDGSTFWFEIVLKPGQAIRPRSAKNLRNILTVLGRPIRVLVAEDNPINQRVVVGYLERMGAKADAVANGHEAIDALRLIDYDLVLMDCQMPELDGYETTRRIRSSASLDCSGIPIIAVTAHALPGERERCLDAGMDDYLAKPLRPQDLADAILRRFENDPISARRPENVSSGIGASLATQDSIAERLQHLRGFGKAGFIAELVSIFEDIAPRFLHQMQDLLEKERYAEVASKAHQLKSSAANLGALSFSKTCAELEGKCSSGSPDGSDLLIRELECRLPELLKELRDASKSLIDRAA